MERKVNMADKDFKVIELGEEEFASMLALITQHMISEVFEKYSLDTCPEVFFSTFIYGLIDEWLEKQGRDKDEFKKFLKVVKKVGASVYEDEREGKL